MALPLVKAFTAPAIGVYFNTYKETANIAPYLGDALCPPKKVASLELKWLKGSRGLPASLDQSNYDAQARVRDRIPFKKIVTEIPFFRESYLVKEQDEVDYENVRNAVDDSAANEILENIMLTPVDLIMGANVVPERMVMQLISPEDGSPKISIYSNDLNLDYNYDKDGEFKKNNFLELTGTDMWSDHENCDPYDDCEKIKEMAADNGITLTHMIMRNAQLKNLVKSKKLQSYIQAANPKGIAKFTKKTVREFFAEELDLIIIINDKKYKDEDGKEHYFYPDTTVTFLPGLDPIGNKCYGRTPEERTASSTGGKFQIVETGVSVYTYNTDHPRNTHCIVSEAVLPSMEGLDRVYVMKAS